MKIAELRDILDRVRELCASAGGKAAAKDLSALNDVLAPHAERSVDEFVATTQRQLSEALAKPKGRGKGSGVPNAAAVASHVAELRRAGADRLAFDRAMDVARANKGLKAAGWAEVARQYASSVTKYKSVAAAQEDIVGAFVRQARFENKLQR
jgi:hypothetical protein